MSIEEEHEKFKEFIKTEVQKAAAALGEHVDAVHIFVTKRRDDGARETTSYDYGVGNYHARLGQVQEWLCGEDEHHRCWVRKMNQED